MFHQRVLTRTDIVTFLRGLRMCQVPAATKMRSKPLVHLNCERDERNVGKFCIFSNEKEPRNVAEHSEQVWAILQAQNCFKHEFRALAKSENIPDFGNSKSAFKISKRH